MVAEFATVSDPKMAQWWNANPAKPVKSMNGMNGSGKNRSSVEEKTEVVFNPHTDMYMDIIEKLIAEYRSVKMSRPLNVSPNEEHVTENTVDPKTTQVKAAPVKQAKPAVKPIEKAVSVVEKRANEYEGATSDDIEIVRNPHPDKYKEIIEQLVADEGWDNSLHCYEIWLRSVGDENFSLWTAFDKRINKIVGTMSRCTYHPKREGDRLFSQFSMLYLRPEYRGLGVGRRLYDPAYEEIKGTNTFCYGVEAMWRKYAKDYGFDKYPDWTLTAMKANCSDVKLSALEPMDPSVEVKDWRKMSFDDICVYDRRLTDGVNRESYLVQALKHPDSTTLVATTGSGNTIVGMCQIRELCLRRMGVSMFYADNQGIARTLLKTTIEAFLRLRSKSLADFSQLVYKTPSKNEKSVEMFSSLVGGKITHRETLVTQFTHQVLNWPVGLIYSTADEHAGLI